MNTINPNKPVGTSITLQSPTNRGYVTVCLIALKWLMQMASKRLPRPAWTLWRRQWMAHIPPLWRGHILQGEQSSSSCPCGDDQEKNPGSTLQLVSTGINWVFPIKIGSTMGFKPKILRCWIIWGCPNWNMWKLIAGTLWKRAKWPTWAM
jgi:hypothetical protein